MTGSPTRRAWSIWPASRAPCRWTTAREDRQDRKDDAVVEREEKFRQQLWRITIEDKKAKLIHPGDFGIGELAVSPDGNRSPSRPTTPARRTTTTGPMSGRWSWRPGATRQLTDGPGGKFHPVWTPDGAAVLVHPPLDPDLSYSQENLFSVALADQGGRQPRRRTSRMT